MFMQARMLSMTVELSASFCAAVDPELPSADYGVAVSDEFCY